MSSYTIDIILTKENMPVKGNRAAPPSSLTGLLVLLTCIQQRAACKQCVTLALGNLTVGLEGLAAANNSDLLAVLYFLEHVRQRDFIQQIDCIVVRRIGKGQRDDTGVDQICLVNSCEGLAQYSLYAQIQRNERCMLTGRALTVVCAADNYAAALLLAAPSEWRGIRCPERGERLGCSGF